MEEIAHTANNTTVAVWMPALTLISLYPFISPLGYASSCYYYRNGNIPGCIYSRDGLIAVEIRLKFENMYSTEKLVFW